MFIVFALNTRTGRDQMVKTMNKDLLRGIHGKNLKCLPAASVETMKSKKFFVPACSIFLRKITTRLQKITRDLIYQLTSNYSTHLWTILDEMALVEAEVTQVGRRRPFPWLSVQRDVGGH